jgi:hypothetical protein
MTLSYMSNYVNVLPVCARDRIFCCGNDVSFDHDSLETILLTPTHSRLIPTSHALQRTVTTSGCLRLHLAVYHIIVPRIVAGCFPRNNDTDLHVLVDLLEHSEHCVNDLFFHHVEWHRTT